MKFRSIIIFVFVLAFFRALGQTATSKSTINALPAKAFLVLRDSTTAMDVVFTQGSGGSISIEGKNVRMFNSFFDTKPAAKTNAQQAGMIMWLINGREFISGNFYLGDSLGYIIFNKDGKEYINLINAQGNSFFKGQIKK